MKLKLFLTISMGLLFSSNSMALFSKSEITDVQSAIKTELRKQRAPGISYTLTHNGQIILKGFEGLSDVSEKSKFNTRTRTSVGSITKTFIGLAVYNLAKKYPKFNTEQKVTNILTWLDRPDMKDITVDHLMSHNSGLQRSLGRDSIANLDTIYEELKYGPYYNELKDIFRDVELMYNRPGVLPQYSNLGYSLLGALIVQVAEDNNYLFKSRSTEDKLTEYIRKEILLPLGIERHTDLMVSSRDFSKEATVYTGEFGDKNIPSSVYRYEWPQLPNLGMAVAHSGVVSNSIGLSKLALEIDKLVVGEPSKIINKDQFNKMTKFAARSYDFSAKSTNWGYGSGGWLYEKFSAETREFVAVGHTGTGYGSRALMFLDPHTGVSVSLIINDKTSNRHAFAKILFDLAFTKVEPNSNRMDEEFRKNYDQAVAGMKEAVALNDQQLKVFPNLSNIPLTALDLYRQLQKSSGLFNVKGLFNSLSSLEFVSGSFGQSWTRRIAFYKNDVEVSPENITSSEMNTVVVKSVSNGKTIDLFKDLEPNFSESSIREGYAPLFLLFSFMQWDFKINYEEDKIEYLVLDRTFYMKAVDSTQLDQAGNSIEPFPFARKVRISGTY